MIRVDELNNFRPQVRCPNGERINLDMIQNAIKDCAEQFGIPVAFRNDQVKSGGFFNATVENCLVMYHPNHTDDYLKFCIRVRRQGTYAFVVIDSFGYSRQMNKAARVEFEQKNFRQADTAGGMIASAFRSGIAGIGKNQQKLEEEQMYYQCISDIFDNIMRG